MNINTEKLNHNNRKKRKHQKSQKNIFSLFCGRVISALAMSATRISILCVLLAAILLTFVFCVIPLLRGPSAMAQPTRDAQAFEPAHTYADITDLSHLDSEMVTEYSNMNEPHISGDNLVFSSTSVRNGIFYYDKLVLYDATDRSCKEIEHETKYDNILTPLICEDYICYIDSNSKGGGNIMGINIKTGEQFLIKAFAYGAPRLSLSDSRIAFMQQSGDNTDKLYLYDILTRESVCLASFSNLPASPTAAHLRGDNITYALPYQSGSDTFSELCVINVSTGEVQSTKLDVLVDSCKICKNSIFYTVYRDGLYDLYMLSGDGSAALIAEGILNFDTGDDFVVYTQNQNICVYFVANGLVRQLNSSVSRGLLASINGTQVVWYDVTGGYDQVDAVRFATLY